MILINQYNTLSGGQKTRVALCKLILRKPDITSYLMNLLTT